MGPSTPAVNGHAEIPFTIPEKINYLVSLLDQGFRIFPLHDLTRPGGIPHCGCRLGTRCPGSGKHPLGKWSNPLDPADPQSRRYVHAAVTQWPARGWGLHIGLSGLAVLDVDPRHGGDDSLDRLVREHDLPLRWPAVATGGGGLHYYFRAPPESDVRRGFVGANGASRTMLTLAPGVELFAGQHYVVLPYSPHASGGWYTLGRSPGPEPLPPPLLSLVYDNPVLVGGSPTSPHAAGSDSTDASGLPASFAGDSPSAEARARAWLGVRDPAVSGQGGRRQSAAVASTLLIDFGLSMDAALRLFVAWNAANMPPWEIDQLRELLGWADGQPGERGRKLRTGHISPRLGHAEDLAWLNQVGVDLVDGEYTYEMRPDGTHKVTYNGKIAIISDEELAAIAGKVSAGIQVDPDDDDDDDDGEDPTEPYECPEDIRNPDKPIIIPAKEDDLAAATAYVYSSGSNCSCSYRILMRVPATGETRVMNFSGRRWDCPRCGPCRRNHYAATMRYWLFDWAKETGGMEDLSLYVAVVPAADWKRVASSLRIRKACFFRIAHLASGAGQGEIYLVLATEKTRHLVWDSITPQQAGDSLEAAIWALPTDITGRVWWSSRHWPLLPDRPQKEKRFERVGRLKALWGAITEVLECWEKRTTQIRSNGRFYPGSGIAFMVRSDEWESIKSDLDCGAPVSLLAQWDASSASDPWEEEIDAIPDNPWV